ncbi:unnamed protein product [Adineta steineri]|uniref:Chitin-binding type-2 domain-containing protein n=1 Tax=Adineta steineri TaxID=433720 RepID=A0A814VI47_9BILA|nr:unnamed protein product [Adineta steineri]
MQLLNHHKRPCDSSSYGYAVIIIICFAIKISFAEYDCSAKEDGWYYDPEFCHIYWRCIHGTSEEFECASGTAWDHSASRCNWLDSVDCSRAEKTTAKVTSEDEETNDDENDTDDDTSIGSTVKSKKKKTTPKKRMLDDNEEDIDLFCFTVCQVNSSAETFCAGRDGFFADPDYCTRYYRCAHGVDQGFECPKGTAWDEESKSCAWIDRVNCDEKKLDYSTNTTTSNRQIDTESIKTHASIPSIVAPTHRGDSHDDTSAIECQPTGIYSIADPTECNSYYQCDKGVHIRLNCPERQLFDTDKRQCMDYERVFCGARALNLADKNQCVNRRDGIHPDTERNCSFYYQCVAKIKVREAKCPDDLKFNSLTTKCGPASAVPMPCGTYILGSASILCMFKFSLYIENSLHHLDRENVRVLISFISMILFLIGFEL